MIRMLFAALMLLGSSGWTTVESSQTTSLSARVVTPASITFTVNNVAAATTAGGQSTVSFDQASLAVGDVMRISVKADGDISMPGGTLISPTLVSWTTSNLKSGVGINGTLSKLAYTPVFEGVVGATSGRVFLSWTLAGPGTSVRAGTGTATLRWKFEAFRR